MFLNIMSRLHTSSRQYIMRHLALPIVMLALCAETGLSQMRNFPNRTEGTWAPHGDADMELLGVVRSRINFKPKTDLRVHFFLPSASTAQASSAQTSVLIQAREIVPLHNYYMQSKPGTWSFGNWNDFGPWPTGDVLDSLGIDSSNLAVLASVRLDTGALAYLPVEVLTTGASSLSSLYTFQLTSSWNLHSVESALITPSGRTEQLPLLQCSAGPTCILHDADTPFSFSLDLGGRPEGIYRVHIVGHVPNNSFHPELSVQIYHRQG
jgi:hypothetical protein